LYKGTALIRASKKIKLTIDLEGVGDTGEVFVGS